MGRDVERRRVAVLDELGRIRPQRRQEAAGVQHLGHADRRHHEHDARSVEQPTDDRELDQRAEARGEQEAGEKGQPVVHPMVVGQLGHEHRGERAQLTVGEVDVPRRLVDQHQPGSEQRVRQPAGDTEDQRLRGDLHARPATACSPKNSSRSRLGSAISVAVSSTLRTWPRSK